MTLTYDDLYLRFGNHIAARLQQAVSASDFRTVSFETLQAFLDHRAEQAHRAYQSTADTSCLTGKARLEHDERLIDLYRRWREAEDLAYLVMIAEDVSAQVLKTATR